MCCAHRPLRCAIDSGGPTAPLEETPSLRQDDRLLVCTEEGAPCRVAFD
jgi:hypothetical protein